MNQQEEKLEEYHLVREVEFYDNVTLQIVQDMRSNEHGASVWDSSLVFTKYLANEKRFPKGFFQGKTYVTCNNLIPISAQSVLELGSGTGCLGIALALIGAKVTITDKKSCLPLIERNVRLNCVPEIQQHVKVQELLWGETKRSDLEAQFFDFIVFADCIYSNKEIWEKLIYSLLDFAQPHKTEIIFAYEVRGTKDLAFFPFAQHLGFVFNEVSECDLDPFYRSPDIVVFNGLYKPKHL